MENEIKADYSKRFLLPPAIEDWVPEDHPVRFIREFVDNLDLSKLDFKRRIKKKGRPNYSNELLLKIWLYGYYELIYSSRKLEKACLNQMPMIWLTGMNYPDHNTIWRFFRRNRKALKEIFKQTVKIAVKSDMVGFVVQAVDGTKIKADSSKYRSIHKDDLNELLSKLDESIEEILLKIDETEDNERYQPGYHLPKRLQDQDNLKRMIKKGIEELSNEEKISLRDTVKKSINYMEEKNVNHLSITDKEARLMKNQSSREYSYNAQAVVDEKNQIIVGSILNNRETDFHNLTEPIDDAAKNTKRLSDETLADSGYFSGEELSQAGSKGYSVIVNIPSGVGKSNSNKDAIVNKRDFKYDKDLDCYQCPKGKNLTFERIKSNKNRRYSVRVYRCKDFRDCQYHKKCSKDKRGRTLERSPYDGHIENQIKKQENNVKRLLLSKRKKIVEPVFGWIKFNNKFSMWTYRGLESVEAQWNLLCTTINLKKLYKSWLLKKSYAISQGFSLKSGQKKQILFYFYRFLLGLKKTIEKPWYCWNLIK